MGQSLSVAGAVGRGIGSRTSDAVTINVVAPIRAGATDHSGGNWLASPIEREMGAFTGSVRAGLGVNELAPFREQLQVSVLRWTDAAAQLPGSRRGT